MSKSEQRSSRTITITAKKVIKETRDTKEYELKRDIERRLFEHTKGSLARAVFSNLNDSKGNSFIEQLGDNCYYLQVLRCLFGSALKDWRYIFESMREVLTDDLDKVIIGVNTRPLDFYNEEEGEDNEEWTAIEDDKLRIGVMYNESKDRGIIYRY